MASSNKRLRATSEILDCLDNCPSESDFTGIDDSDLDDDVLSNEVRMDMENSSFESDPEHVVSDLDERIYDSPDL